MTGPGRLPAALLPGLLVVPLFATVAVACAPNGRSGTVVIDGLSQPRGLAVDDGTVCVAEAGAIGPGGPVRERPGRREADTGRVLCGLTGGGAPTVVLDGLPFVHYPDAAVTSGAADVIVSGERTFVLVGESYGALARSIVEIGPDGPRQIADLLAFAERSAGGDGLLSNPYSFAFDADGLEFLVADAASGSLLRVGLEGEVATFAPVPGHEVLTGVTFGPDGDLYVASFGQLPHAEGTGAVLAVDPSGRARTVLAGLTMPIDVTFDDLGGMYVLEYATPVGEPTGVAAYRDRSGRLSYVPSGTDVGNREFLLDGLDRPTAVVAIDGGVLVSESVGELAAGEGAVVRYSLDRAAGG